jgi:hypothetical protein
MDLTSFKNLKRAVNELGASPILAKLDKQLIGKGIVIDTNADQVVVGENGIYYVDPSGILTKTVVHIVDMSVKARYARQLRTAVEQGDFESDYVLDKIHKYHLMRCKTIETAEEGGRLGSTG